MAKRIGVVLAGGLGLRMGRPKGEMVFEGQTLAERAGRTLSPLCGTVRISIAPGMKNPAPEFVAVEDAPPGGRGPLAGIEAAFRVTGDGDLLVLACDYPFADTLLLRALAVGDEADLVMPTDLDGRDHPLVGLWRRSAAAEVGRALRREVYKVRAMLSSLNVRRLGPAELSGVDLKRALQNWNAPGDRPSR